ncbi:MAG: beta-ketoacyl synthase chain length factor [Deltaproteobacteria bacterium]|nr:beta-ketoacyl synthase chain length factor [Deltaproteobacteria bacterium]
MIAINGIGFWAPGFADLGAFREGRIDADLTMPKCELVTGRAKRGTSRIGRMLAEVTSQAAADAAVDLGTVPTVYASAWGEIDIMVNLLGQIADGDVGLSPLRFKHSVHNSASGMVSIAAGNRTFSTALAAGRRTFEQGVLEALTYLTTTDADHVILAVAEDRLPAPLDRFGEYEALAVAVCFGKEPREGAHGALSFPRRADEARLPTLPPVYAENPTAFALPLLDALVKPGGADGLALSAARRPFAVDVSSADPSRMKS